MTWVKVCGVRKAGEIDAAAEAGADAVGLMLARSPRELSLSEAKTLAHYAAEAHPHLRTVAVTVHARESAIQRVLSVTGVTGIQLHGEYAAETAIAVAPAGSELLVLRPVPVGDSLGETNDVSPHHRPLFDTKVPGAEGGSGVVFDWSLVADVDREFVLAGGLGPENVSQAIAETRAWGVDASSGLESSLGIKDLGRIRDFVQGAKA